MGYPMCEEMELPLDYNIAQEWLQGRNQAKGLALEDFKQLYGRILSAQGPAVRAVASGKTLRLPDVARTETVMRAVFDKSTVGGQTSPSQSDTPSLVDTLFRMARSAVASTTQTPNMGWYRLSRPMRCAC